MTTTAVALVLALTTTACPIPIAHTEALNPAVVGVFRGSDESPIAGARVAVSVEYNDSTCAEAIEQTTTDSAGVFRLPTTEQRHAVKWFIPMFHAVDPRYRLCVSVGDTLQTAFFGRGALEPPAPRDSIDCVAWAWENRPRVTCSAFAGPNQTLSTGGRWRYGPSHGWYRLILTEGLRHVPGYRVPQKRPRAYVQWVEVHGNGAQSVREIAELPIDPKVTALWEIVLVERSSKWHATLHGFKPKFMHDFAETDLVFVLGGPGEVQPVNR